ncbi:homoserine kinase [Altererythrobacter confluentis]|uniref:Homoserine kinase n=1 Tax=Allopontixanthobacter confluentis TaxID=1849021 RepID=A0A6L7GBT2_9SPHN|nr:homoserine kinase [Allopontixanthobacter confluentis]MXP13433.1 homoserine kinase [Allopontixanthobacter confluentis]
MAVYTHLGADDLAGLIAEYNVGSLLSAKGIAEGVSNSNWLLETSGADGHGAARQATRFILTMYERRIELDDLPFFLGLLDHLAARGGPVPRTIHDRSGAAFRMMDGKAVALIEYLPGVSIDRPSPAQARAVGRALAGMHVASADFAATRANDLAPPDWQDLFQQCGSGLATINASLPRIVETHLSAIMAGWPDDLPRTTIHADLFPDNVLMLGDDVSGMIDFYFACTDMAAYDLAVTHAAWSFGGPGTMFKPEIGQALVAGYEDIRPLTQAERAALPLLAQGAAMRFVATRAFDWINTPDDALVARKDPMDFVKRLQFYAEAGDGPFTPAPR